MTAHKLLKMGFKKMGVFLVLALTKKKKTCDTLTKPTCQCQTFSCIDKDTSAVYFLYKIQVVIAAVIIMTRKRVHLMFCYFALVLTISSTFYAF